jgi:DNA-binding MarR family transcriptional regulator
MDAESNESDRSGTTRWEGLPGLDPSVLEVAARVIALSGHLTRSVNPLLIGHGLNLVQYDILAALRRHGPESRVTMLQLAKSVILSYGNLDFRLTLLEKSGLIRRLPDPADSRGKNKLIALTAKGREAIEAAAGSGFKEAKKHLMPLTVAERQRLAGLLQKWLEAIVQD